MRILVASDLHYRLPHFDWLVGAAEDVDVVLLAGDLADVISPVPHEVQTVVVAKYLRHLADRAAVFAASGNHDLDGPGPHGEQVARWLSTSDHDDLHLDGSSVDLERHPVHGVPVVGRPGDPRGGRRAAPRRGRRPARSAGSGSTTRLRPAPPCATTGGVASPTRSSPTGSPS